MRRLLPVIFLFLLVIPPAQAQGSVRGIQTAVDARFAALWSQIVIRETMYYQQHGRYFQGLPTHSQTPDGSNDAALDLQSSKPTDQADNWLDFLDTDIPASLPFSLLIDVYDGPAGSGFSATLQVQINGQLYARTQATGPERQRVKGWALQ